MNGRLPFKLICASAVGLLWIAASCAAIAQRADAGASVIEVDAQDFMFRPQTLTVKAGATVTWTNLDQEPHTIVSDTGLFRSSAIDTHESFSFRFDRPGTYRYLCTIHPRMIGTVVVQ